MDNTPGYLNKEGFPIVKEPITLRIFAAQAVFQPEYQDIYLMQKYEEITGIKIEWINVPRENLKEKVNLAFASGDLPDAFLKCSIEAANQLRYGQEGLILNLNENDLLQKYAPNFYAYMQKFPDVRQSQTFPNGAIYSIPAATEAESTRINRKIFYNKDWLTKLNLEQPTTTDELYNVLKAFKTMDPNGNGEADEIPFSQTPGNLYQIFAGAFGLMNRGVHHTEFDVDETTGKVRHIRTAPEYREMLAYLNKLYSEGLIDQECFNYTDQIAAAWVAQDRLGMYVNTNLAQLPKEKAEATFVACESAIKGPNGDQLWPSIRSHLHSTGAFVITTECKYPEAALRWVDYFYSDEGVLFYHYGIEGDTCVKNSDGSYDYAQKIYDEITGNKSFDEVIAKYSPYVYGNNPTIMKYPYFSGQEMTPIPMKAAANLMPYTPKEVWPFFTYTDEETQIINEYSSAVNDYCMQMSAEFLTGRRPLDDKNWDEYVKTVHSLGLDKLLEAQEAAYSRIK